MKTHHNFDSTEYYQYDATFPSTGSDDGDDDDKDDYAPVGAMATDRDEEFCNGMSMTMSMGGFQSSLFGKQKADCLTYLFKKWMLNTSGKFQGAMGTFENGWGDSVRPYTIHFPIVEWMSLYDIAFLTCPKKSRQLLFCEFPHNLDCPFVTIRYMNFFSFLLISWISLHIPVGDPL